MSKFSAIVADQLDPHSLAVFGDEVEYIQKAGGSYTLTGVLSSGTELQQTEKVFQTLWAPLTSFTLGEPMSGDIVIHDSVRYRVAGSPERDAMGGRMLKLAVTS